MRPTRRGFLLEITFKAKQRTSPLLVLQIIWYKFHFLIRGC